MQKRSDVRGRLESLFPSFLVQLDPGGSAFDRVREAPDAVS
jgi:hypothetical protein